VLVAPLLLLQRRWRLLPWQLLLLRLVPAACLLLLLLRWPWQLLLLPLVSVAHLLLLQRAWQLHRHTCQAPSSTPQQQWQH
jgi:membrane protein implicated in regulation of membrane protease activity